MMFEMLSFPILRSGKIASYPSETKSFYFDFQGVQGKQRWAVYVAQSESVSGALRSWVNLFTSSWALVSEEATYNLVGQIPQSFINFSLA